MTPLHGGEITELPQAYGFKPIRTAVMNRIFSLARIALFVIASPLLQAAPDIDPSVWFECQFFVKDSPMIVKNPGK
jgi:hypothetical protein